jgi:hypothetical protein
MTSRRQTLGLTLLALIAFAANSIFCRLALHAGAIDAMSFTSVRLLSGALMLALLVYLRSRHQNTLTRHRFNPLPACCLFGYALLFSWAYTLLDTGTGALILFGAVQLTMIGRSLLGGSHLTRLECGGIALAISGLTYLLLPDARRHCAGYSGSVRPRETAHSRHRPGGSPTTGAPNETGHPRGRPVIGRNQVGLMKRFVLSLNGCKFGLNIQRSITDGLIEKRLVVFRQPLLLAHGRQLLHRFNEFRMGFQLGFHDSHSHSRQLF